MSKRITVMLDDEAAEVLPRLAGGARKQGEFLSRLIHQAINQEPESGPSDLETLRLQVRGIIGELQNINSRLVTLETRNE
jgi:hypothetical protein